MATGPSTDGPTPSELIDGRTLKALVRAATALNESKAKRR